MVTILLVGILGGLGAVSRYLLDRNIQGHTDSFFPFGTFAVNMLGATALGVIDGLGAIKSLPGVYVAVLCVGFVGGFTTFSTLMYESFSLLTTRGQRTFGVLNLLATVVLGIALYSIAFSFTKTFG